MARITGGVGGGGGGGGVAPADQRLTGCVPGPGARPGFVVCVSSSVSMFAAAKSGGQAETRPADSVCIYTH